MPNPPPPRPGTEEEARDRVLTHDGGGPDCACTGCRELATHLDAYREAVRQAAFAEARQPIAELVSQADLLERIGNDYTGWAHDSDERERDIEWGFALIGIANRLRALATPPDTGTPG